MTTRLLYLVSHPIQYQAPLLRRLAREPDIELRVLFEKLDSAASYYDPGFARTVSWDVSLLDGYEYVALKDTDLTSALADCDVLWMHGWQSWVARRALSMARRQRVPVLMRAENWDGAMPDGAGMRGWLKRWFLQWVFSRCAGFLAVGSRNRLYYERRGIKSSRIFLMPYGIDNAFFREGAAAAQKHRQNLRRDLKIEDGQSVVLVPGKMIARKHPEHALAAWRRIVTAPADLPGGKSPALVFVGDGPLMASLREQVMPGEPVHFLGFRNQTELPALYELADVVLVPSEQEPWGLVVNEAMACGTAVIATDQVGAAFDLIGLETTAESPNAPGLVVPFGELDTFAEALKSVLRNSARMGQSAMDRVAAFDFEAQAAGLKSAVSACVLEGGPCRID
ncbi:MAG: glycosyltransferase family 4 protein [Rhodospirillales bacterium]